MDISVKELEEATSIRRQIDNLQQRLSSILRGTTPRTVTVPAAKASRSAQTGRYFSPATRAKLAAAARARWARLRGGATTTTAATPARKKGQLTPAGRRKLSQLMKARWAARRKTTTAKKAAPAKKKGALTAAGRRRLSELMKARWAARRKASK